MTKIINAILGIGTAVIISLFFILALKMAFQTDWVDCYEDEIRDRPYLEKNITIERQKEIDECYEENREQRNASNRKIFISSVIIGTILVLLIIPLLFQTSLASGVGASGIFLIIYGFARGWETSGDLIKLILLFITAVLIIGITLFLNKDSIKSKTKAKKQ